MTASVARTGQPATGQLSGVLSGTGHDQLRLVVLTDQIPHAAPAELESIARPVYDSDGHLCDWRLDVAHAEHPLSAEDFQRFTGWRRGFAVERYLGERALITAFLDWAAGHCSVSKLQVLRLDHARIDYHRALEMGRQLEQVRDYLGRHTASGLGLFSPTARKSIRGFIAAAEPTTVLALGTVAVLLTPDGLSLRQPGGPVPLLGWHCDDSNLAARTAEGELPLTGDAARLLRIVGRQATDIEVRDCPIGDLIAPLLSFGKDATDVAGTAHNGMYLYSS